MKKIGSNPHRFRKGSLLLIALSVSDISLDFGGDEVLKNITFAINEGERVGVIGSNGAGKTSLLRIIAGELSQSTGEVFFAKGACVGLLQQNADLSALPGELTVLEYMYGAFSELISLEERIARTESEITSLAEAGNQSAAVSRVEELERLNSELDKRGGREFRSRCRGTLLRLGFEEEALERKISTLSGGQYTRLALARLLATEPDILMLDEPTNHLDTDAIQWLESYIAQYKKTVIIVSHDRYFLDKTTTMTLSIRAGTARLYHGNYSFTKEQQEQDAASLEKRYREQQKQIAKIKANIEFQRRCNREHNFVTIRSKEKQLARMEKITLEPKEGASVRMSFASEGASANDVLDIKGLSFFRGERPILTGLDLFVRRNERVLILGKNGCGKSTLLKLINGALSPTEGRITLGYNIKIGYYDQENRGLSEGKTVFDELHDEYPEKTDLEIRNTLALFLFTGDDVQKRVSVLSGGERARLTLSKLILKKVNLLVIDEPTNHLDISSCEALENALLAFDGTVIAVSHDRYFINRIATRIVELDAGRTGGIYDYPIEDYDDAFGEYMRLRQLSREKASAQQVKETASTSSRAEFEARKRDIARQRGEQRRIEQAKARIAELECEIEKIDAELFGEAASDYVRAQELDKRKSELEEELLKLYEMVF